MVDDKRFVLSKNSDNKFVIEDICVGNKVVFENEKNARQVLYWLKDLSE